MLGPGTLVGLPSLLRAEGCEDVSAATAVIAWVIPDKLWLRFIPANQAFGPVQQHRVPFGASQFAQQPAPQNERAPFGHLMY